MPAKCPIRNSNVKQTVILNSFSCRYVPWNLHEPEEGVYDFGTEGRDFSMFLGQYDHTYGAQWIILISVQAKLTQRTVFEKFFNYHQIFTLMAPTGLKAAAKPNTNMVSILSLLSLNQCVLLTLVFCFVLFSYLHSVSSHSRPQYECRTQTLSVISRVFLHFYIYFCYQRMSLTLKICQTVAGISMVYQFHDFLNLILGGFFTFSNKCSSLLLSV